MAVKRAGKLEKPNRTLDDTIKEFEANDAARIDDPLVMAPAGATINLLRAQMGLLILKVKDIEKGVKPSLVELTARLNHHNEEFESFDMRIKEIENSITLIWSALEATKEDEA